MIELWQLKSPADPWWRPLGARMPTAQAWMHAWARLVPAGALMNFAIDRVALDMGVSLDNMVVPASIANVLTVLIVWGMWAGPTAEALFGWSPLKVREFPTASHWLMERGMRLLWSASVVVIALWWGLWIGRTLVGATCYWPNG